MFTGLVEELGTVLGIAHGPQSARLHIAAERVLTDVAIGDSIAVNGVCLTVVEFTAKSFQADVMAETLRRSDLGELRAGSRVNLERAAALGSRLGGHLVSGHIDGVGRICSIRRQDIALLFEIAGPPQVLRYVVEKGSVAVDGISLTVVAVDNERFSVSLIPHTAAVTTLGGKKEGDPVNLEGDIIGKYVERLLRYPAEPDAPKKGMSMEFLAENGFL